MSYRLSLVVAKTADIYLVMLFNVAPLLDGRNQAGIILAVFLGYYIKRRFFTSKKRSGKLKNPFAQDSRSPLTPLVIEQEIRNEILKKGMNDSVLTNKVI